MHNVTLLKGVVCMREADLLHCGEQKADQSSILFYHILDSTLLNKAVSPLTSLSAFLLGCSFVSFVPILFSFLFSQLFDFHVVSLLCLKSILIVHVSCSVFLSVGPFLELKSF